MEHCLRRRLDLAQKLSRVTRAMEAEFEPANACKETDNPERTLVPHTGSLSMAPDAAQSQRNLL